MSVERTQALFDYVDRTGIRMMPFIRIPKYLLEEPFFHVLSVEAILLYSILLDRLELSLCNDWFDEHGHAYVIYTLNEIQKTMRCCRDKAIRLLRELDGVENRRARFRTVVTLILADGQPRFFEGACEGSIAREQRGTGGFGYDPVFLPDAYPGRTLAEVSEEEKNAVSHRGRAIRAMAAWLKSR